ncbi:LuxR C-terminal-related transcriptional regulator [Paenibacillus pasadenensis]|uniref:LuxR C-terminal-related transcriptional regulator n=1 Tax=Paenibacillus pasadenensis TaxID=217090 RepID=UPI00203BCD04|nr:LuxR C-terminal-related transcriptional regulator [Paenibacillus pasadenensis]MCM3749213.1 LuxR C-terminal-related transcriptional regulator [Paenibacillus pasadenensis]
MNSSNEWMPPLAKITPPSGQGKTAARPRLLQKMNGNPARLTAVAAPAGYGKTTLLRQWAVGFAGPIAWLALDEPDNEPSRFWRLAACALAQALPPGALARSLPLSSALPGLSIYTFLDALTGELQACGCEAALVMDDFHHIKDRGIIESMTYWLRYLPAKVRVIVAGRSVPRFGGSRWQSEGRRLDLAAADLRFTEEEADVLLDLASREPLTGAQRTRLLEHTEGWAAGLQLAALAGAPAGAPDLSEELSFFLMEEVYERQPAEVRSFLRVTAVLDSLDAELAAAAVGCGQARAALLMERIQEDNLFLLPVGGAGSFRYHSLFRDFLLGRPEPEPGAERAALWRAARKLADRGMMVEAIRCSLDCGDYDYTGELISAYAGAAFRQGELPVLLGLLSRYAEARELSAEQRQLHAFLLAVAGRGSAAAAVLAAARQDTEAMPDSALKRRLRSGLLFVESNLIFFSGRFELWHSFSERAGSGLLAEEALYYNIDFNRSEPLVRRTELGMKGVLSSDTEAIGLRFTSLLQQGGWGESYVSLYVRQALAEGYFEWNRLEESEALLAGLRGAKSSREVPGLAVPMAILQANLYAARGLPEEAADVLDEAERLPCAEDAHWQAYLQSAQVRLLLQAGKTAQAKKRLGPTDQQFKEKPAYHREYEFMTQVRLLLKQQKSAQALRMLESLKRLQEREGLLSGLAESAILQALAEQCRGRRDRALQYAAEALERSEPHCYIRLFVNEGEPMRQLLLAFRTACGEERGSRLIGEDAASVNSLGQDEPAALLRQSQLLGYANRLLRCFAYAPPRLLSVETPAEPLTEIELTLLRLVGEGAANRDIAARLALSPGTVRVYLSRLYDKLGVSSRTQALHTAKELQLLEEGS